MGKIPWKGTLIVNTKPLESYDCIYCNNGWCEKKSTRCFYNIYIECKDKVAPQIIRPKNNHTFFPPENKTFYNAMLSGVLGEVGVAPMTEKEIKERKHLLVNEEMLYERAVEKLKLSSKIDCLDFEQNVKNVQGELIEIGDVVELSHKNRYYVLRFSRSHVILINRKLNFLLVEKRNFKYKKILY